MINLYLDIELVFEIRFLQLGLSKRDKFIDKTMLKELYYKPILEGFRILGCLPVDIKDYVKTIRYKIEGYHLLNNNSQYNISLLGEIEPELYSIILQENHCGDIPQISSNDLIALLVNDPNSSVKVITSQELMRTAAEHLGKDVEYIPLEGDLNFTYICNTIPWDNYLQLNTTINISGNIVKGFGRGSKDLGFPTANIDFQNNLSLVPGIYAGLAKLEGRFYKAALSIGWCPFYNNEHISYEVYLLADFSENLVGKFLELGISYYIRSESSFRKLQDLIQAITLDVALTDKLITIVT